MVEVKLAGMNVPVYILKDIKELRERIDESSRLRGSELLRILVELEELSEQFTPEILSAAYARISRSPEDVNELVVEASQDVTKARKSNENIIYGMGHHSVADHAIFNFNITGVSRLAVESIEERRIAGYTEKSQRYITLDGDYVKPKEFSSEDLKKFEELVEFQNDFYFRNNPKLFDYLKKKFSKEINKLEGRKKKDYEKKLEGSAKEDARYSLCLATEAQLGCSYPGQTLELAIRKLKHGRLTEEREISKQLFDETVQYAPSLIQLTDPEIFRQHNPGQELQEDNFKYTKQNLRDIVEKAFEKDIKPVDSSTLKFYRFSHDTPFASLRDEDLGNKDLAVFFKNGNATFVKCNDIDMNILAAMLHQYSKESIENSYALAYELKKEHKAQDFVEDALKQLSAYDKVPRAFEMSNGLMFEAIISSSCFAQLKRHRMNTLLSQDYNPELGFTVPPNIADLNADKQLREVVDRSSELYYEFLPKYGKAAEYCLTNAHRRRVFIGINMRQLHHVSRTREDKHAQWEIRELVNRMNALAKQEAPITTMLLGGQHEFNTIKKRAYRDKR